MCMSKAVLLFYAPSLKNKVPVIKYTDEKEFQFKNNKRDALPTVKNLDNY